MLKFIKRYGGTIILCLIIVFFGIFAIEIDFANIIDYLSRLGSDFVVVIIATAVAYFFAVLAWFHCMDEGTRNKFEIYELYIVRIIGESFTLINPANIVGGEALKVGLLNNHSVDSNLIGQSVFISRILIIVSFIILLIVSIVVVFFGTSIELPIWQFVLLIVTSIILLYFFIRTIVSSELLISKSFSYILAIIPNQKWKSNFLRWVHKFNYQIVSYFKRSPGSFKWALLYSFCHWLISSMEFYIILMSFGVDINYFEAITLEIGVMIFKSLGGFIPGQVGIEEFGNKLMLSVLHFDGFEIWLAVSLIRRARQLFWLGLALTLVSTLYREKSKQLLSFGRC